jgi:membrane protease YdiL (CAAX protease family)
MRPAFIALRRRKVTLARDHTCRAEFSVPDARLALIQRNVLLINDRMTSQLPRWRWWIHLILVGGYFFPGTILALTHIRKHPALTSTPGGLLIVCGIELSAFACVFALGWLASRFRLDDLYLGWRPGWWVVPLGAGYSILLRLVVAFALIGVVLVLTITRLVPAEAIREYLTVKRPDFDRVVNATSLQHDAVYFWLTITAVSFVLAGLREELWRVATLAAMRSLWPRAFDSTYGQYFAMGIIALVFGIAHLPLGVMAAAAAGLIGFLLGSLIIFHRSIWPAVFAHGFFDATTFALLPFALPMLEQLHRAAH